MCLFKNLLIAELLFLLPRILFNNSFVTNFPCKLVIDLYLSGYKNVEVSEADAVTVPFETDDRYNSLAADGLYFVHNIYSFCFDVISYTAPK